MNNDDLVRELRLQIEELKQDKAFLKQEISSVRRDFDDFKLLIEHKAKTEVTETAETVSKQDVSSLGEQKKQAWEQVETPLQTHQEQPKKLAVFLNRLLKLR